MTILYTGQCRGGETLATITDWGWRELRQPTDGRVRRQIGYAGDNGAYAQFINGREYDPDKAVERLLVDESEIGEAAFAVVPDKVAEGMESLRYSVWWAATLAAVADSPRALAVQDGMGEEDVVPLLNDFLFQGLFVGGSTAWKWATAARWVAVAHDNGAWCHVGRASSARRYRYCRAIGADSADSNQAIRSTNEMRKYRASELAAVRLLPPPTERVTRTTAPIPLQGSLF